MDTLAEWSRRRPAEPMRSPRVGSNPTGVDCVSVTFAQAEQSHDHVLELRFTQSLTFL